MTEISSDILEEARRIAENVAQLDPEGQARMLMLSELVRRGDLVTNAAIEKWKAQRLSREGLWDVVRRQYRLMTQTQQAGARPGA